MQTNKRGKEVGLCKGEGKEEDGLVQRKDTKEKLEKGRESTDVDA